VTVSCASESSDPRRSSGLPVGDLLDTTTVTVDLATPACALAIGAHPDDIEFGAGAALARWAAAGCQVHHLVLTDGSKGSWDPNEDLDRLVADRIRECREAAAVLDGTGRAAPEGEGASDRVHFLGKVDGELENDDDTRRAVARVIRTVRPDVLLGHDPWRRYRLHPDHRTAGFLTLDSLVSARDPHFFADLDLPPHRPTALLLWEADLPNHVERADGFVDAKIDALLCHRSQLETTMGLRPDTGVRSSTADGPVDGRADFASRIGWQMAQHGALAHVDAGEAFHLMVEL
jgi:LmbE family N-acetylglucosaminyl deacetylase